MQNSIFEGLKDKSVSLLGYGVSNSAVCECLLKNGIFPTVRNEKIVDLPNGANGIFGGDYLNAEEDVVFRSPAIRGEKISKDSRVYTEISFSLENTQAHKIGITGSDGKTTTATLIYEILKADEKASYLVGNIGNPLISYIDKIESNDFIVSELSSFQLFDYTPSLDVAVVTSISENHLDWHKDMSEYVLSKRNIVKNAKCVVLNYDMPYRELFDIKNTVYCSLSDLSPIILDKKRKYYVVTDDDFSEEFDIVNQKYEYFFFMDAPGVVRENAKLYNMVIELENVSDIVLTEIYIENFKVYDIITNATGVCIERENIREYNYDNSSEQMAKLLLKPHEKIRLCLKIHMDEYRMDEESFYVNFDLSTMSIYNVIYSANVTLFRNNVIDTVDRVYVSTERRYFVNMPEAVDE